MRLRIVARRGDAAYFDRAVQSLSDLPEVQAAQASPATASLLLQHTAGAAESIVAQRVSVACSRSVLPCRPTSPLHYRRAQPSSPSVTPLNAAAASFIGLGLVQAMRGRFHGNAVESFWNAYLLHALHGRPMLSVGLVGLGVYQLATWNRAGVRHLVLLYGLAARNQEKGDTAEEPG